MSTLIVQIIYNAKGSNRTWEWLSMVSVSIFALRDVMKQVHGEFQTPFNSTSHTSPSTEFDIQVLLEYLEAQSIQTYFPDRENNSDSQESRDLLQSGSKYSNKASTYQTFLYSKVKTSFRPSESVPSNPDPTTAVVDDADTCEDDEAANVESEDDEEDEDEDTRLHAEFEDLLLDQEEYPIGSNGRDYVAAMQEIVTELSNS